MFKQADFNRIGFDKKKRTPKIGNDVRN